jgi:hypothetical protein
VNHFAPRSAQTRTLLAGAIALAATLATGCDKAKEEPVASAATVVMPGSPAPTEASAPPSAAPAALASNSNDASSPPPGITVGGSTSGGTLSVISGTAPAPAVTATPPSTGSTPPSPLDPTALPPAMAASRGGPGVIGPNPAASGSADDQPPNVPPGTKN